MNLFVTSISTHKFIYGFDIINHKFIPHTFAYQKHIFIVHIFVSKSVVLSCKFVKLIISMFAAKIKENFGFSLIVICNK